MASHEEFVHMLQGEVGRGAMKARQALDLLIQKAHFDAQRAEIERDHRNRVVGFVAGRMKVANTVQEILGHGRRGKLVYFEAIGFDIL
jgi:hypothetical protein